MSIVSCAATRHDDDIGCCLGAAVKRVPQMVRWSRGHDSRPRGVGKVPRGSSAPPGSLITDHCNTWTFDPVNPVYINDCEVGSDYSQIKEV